MAKLIEYQMHEFLIEKEEQRCKELEKEYAKNPETRNKRVKRNKVVKPWSRLSPSALCQETDLFPMVREYSYDLTDKSFLDYCDARGILHVAGEINSKSWKIFENHKLSKEKYLKDPFFQFAEEVSGKKHKYSDEEMEIGWRIIQIGRAKLQDCWEIYSQSNE